MLVLSHRGVSVSHPMAMVFVALTSLISFIYLLFIEDLLQAFSALRLAAGDQHRQVTTAGAVPSHLLLPQLLQEHSFTLYVNTLFI